MRRWNGWGDDTQLYPLPAGASDFLQRVVGSAAPPRDATLPEALAAVPPSRLPAHGLVSTDSFDRLNHARGQSMADWIALRSGRIGAYPDGVARPTSSAEVRRLFGFASETGARLIPYGGGTSVVGHVNPRPGPQPVLTVDLSRLSSLVMLDEQSQLATFGAGIAGPALERALNERGLTLGHFPQSFELSTLGGWIATRSSGQQSLRYGRIEQLFAGGHLESPAGALELPAFPASAAGPDLREAVLGSEGRMGILTEATVRVSPLPEREAFHAVFFPGWDEGAHAARRIVQARLPLSMLRFSTPEETETTLALAGHRVAIGAIERLLTALGAGLGRCMMVLGFSGPERVARVAREEALSLCKAERGVHLGRLFGEQWHKNRFRSPYLRNTLWEAGYAVDTLETAASWSKIPALVPAIGAALRLGLSDLGERVHAFSHLSHVYPTGSSLYTTYVFRLTSDPEENLRRWQVLKGAASRAICSYGGTISHQHGVGEDHLPYLEAEKGRLGVAALQQLCRFFDPKGMMNPGKLV